MFALFQLRHTHFWKNTNTSSAYSTLVVTKALTPSCTHTETETSFDYYGICVARKIYLGLGLISSHNSVL